jgi:ribosomal protein L40E
MDETKVCTKCNRQLPHSAFNKRRDTADGLRYQCKECRYRADSVYQKAHRSEMNEYWREWHQKRIERLKEAAKAPKLKDFY